MREIKQPMIQAIGEDEFKQGLDKLPEYYSNEHKGNYKAIGMQLMWDTRFVDVNVRLKQPDRVVQEMTEAYALWESGLSRQEAVKKALIASGWGGHD